MPENAVRETGIFEVLPTNVVECFGAVGRAHPIHLGDHKPQVGQRSKSANTAKRLWDIRSLRARINLLNDRVLFGWIKIFWAVDDSPDVGFAIAAFCHKDLRRFPAAVA